MAFDFKLRLHILKKHIKKIKFLVFIPVSLLAIGIINYLFMRLLNFTIDWTTNWYRDINIFYFLLLAPFFWGTVWGIFKLTAIGLAALLIPVSPDRNFSLYSLGILSLINCIALIVYYWTRDVNYSWRVMFMSFIITVFVIDFSSSILLVFSKKESHGFDE
jgi:hypothetical protein